MVVDNFHILGPRWCPAETHAPLIVDSDAELASSISMQRLEPVTGRHSQILEAGGDLQLAQLAASRGFDAYKAPDSEPTRQIRRVPAPE
jgi:hypothetical protein